MPDDKNLIVFSGLKHCGKSTLARLVAQSTRLVLADLDQMIAGLAAAEHPELGNPADYPGLVRRLYRGYGKQVFQEYEERAVSELCRTADSRLRILALGGGSMENPRAMETLSRYGFIIFLDAPFEVLLERILRGGVPAFLDPDDPEGSFHRIYDQRRVLALSQADLVIAIGKKNIEEVFDEIIIPIKEFIHGR